MRAVLTIIHRYVGLAIAAVLIIAGITGAIIAWAHELDERLNPELFHTSPLGSPRPAGDIARELEQCDPRLRVTYLPVSVEPGASLPIFVEPRLDLRTGRAYELGFNQVFVDPISGNELGRREWGQTWPITRATLIPFLYKLHYSLHIPALGGEPRVGLRLMGGVAIVWFADCFVGLCLTLPRRHRGVRTMRPGRSWWARWRTAWAIKTGASRYRLVFDIHRATGLWAWGLLLVIAFSGFSLALNAEVVRPLLSTFATVTPMPLDTPPRIASDKPSRSMSISEIIERARGERRQRHIELPLGAIAYDAAHNLYSALFFAPGAHGGDGGAEPLTLYMNADDGAIVGSREPWSGTAADIVLQAQFPLHSGRILGAFGRIVVSLVGLLVAGLSLSGLIVWWRKRAARLLHRRLHAAAAART